MNIKKMILSGGMLVFVAAVVVGGTGAFFSDTETAEGNVFTAGSVSIDLGSFSHTYNGDENNAPEFTTPGGTSFALDDLKPLDNGNINIGLDNGANEAHVCAMINNDPDDDIGAADMALYDLLNFWIEGEDTQVTPGDWFDLGTVAANSPVDTGVDYCFGDANVTAGGLQSCDHGGLDYNPAQGGSFTADIMFYAVQTRNNEDFSCEDLTMNDDGEPVYEPTPTQFELDDTNSPGTADNIEGETADNAPDGQPYFTYNFVDGGVEVTFENPSAFPFVFDYRVDDEAGEARDQTGTDLTNTEIGEGPLSGQDFGQTYNRVVLNGGESQTITIMGDNEISVGLREGAEQKWYIDWVNFVAVN